jgi:hypothetical protein
MRSKQSFNLEKSLFICATEALKRVHELGFVATGNDALLAADYIRRPAMKRMVTEDLTAEDRQYFERMGGYVELAAELSSPVDQQG